MEIITSLEHQVAAARHLLDGVPEGESLPGFLQSLPDDGVLAVLEIGAALVRLGQRLELPASGIVAQRSTRSRGQTGMAQTQGHRDAVSLVQQLTGVSRSQAAREVKVGQSLVEAAEASQLGSASSGGIAGGVEPLAGTAGEGTTDGGTPAEGLASAGPADGGPVAAWHTPLDRASDAGTISPDQYTAIRQGLGDPPIPTEADIAAVIAATTHLTAPDTPNGADTTSPDTADMASPSISEVEAFQQATSILHHTWAIAAVNLLAEAQVRSLDELRKACRAVRDELDPVGSTRRFDDRYAARSFRMWVDDKGTHRASFTLDDESAAWLRSIIDSAMRPRRGGPRFMNAEEQANATALREDPRTNDQLTHDLIIDVLRGGTLANAADVFGVRQAGVRVVQVVDAPAPGSDQTDTSTGHAFLESDGTPVPPGIADRTICNTGTVPVTVDRRGNPLNVGREQRLFTSKQRIALSLRDGGCRWTNCDRPAAYCEAHHIDEWHADHGHTDIARGILLCRYHHLQLHNSGWRITRDGDGPFYLHKPGSPVARREVDHTTSGEPSLSSTDQALAPAPAPAPAPGPGPGPDPLFSLGDARPPDAPIELPIRVIRAYAWGSAPQPSVRFRPGQSTPPKQVPPEVWGERRPSQILRSRN